MNNSSFKLVFDSTGGKIEVCEVHFVGKSKAKSLTSFEEILIERLEYEKSVANCRKKQNNILGNGYWLRIEIGYGTKKLDVFLGAATCGRMCQCWYIRLAQSV